MKWKHITTALASLGLWACLDRNYENPFLSEDGEISAEWKKDRDGNGIADSVEFYAKDCKGTPAECLRRARDAAVIAKIDKGQTGPKDTLKPVDPPRPPKDSGKPVDPPKPPKDSVKPVDPPKPPKDTVKPADPPKPPKDTAKPMDPPKPPKDTLKPVDPPKPPKDTLKPVDPPRPPKDTLKPVDPPKPPRDTVIVRPPVKAVTGIQVAAIYIPMGVAKATPSVAVLPRDAANQGYTLTSLDETIVKVSGQDLIPVKPGTATVRARSDEGGFTREFEAAVIVRDTNKYEEQITVSPMALTVGDPPRAPEITWKPADVTNRGYSLVSSHPAYVLVVSDGGLAKCKAVAPGEATLTLKTQGKGLIATFKVVVKAAQVLVASVSAPDLTLEEGSIAIPQVAILPAGVGNKAYTLASDNLKSVTVQGKAIKAEKKGTAVITITAAEGGKTGTFTVTVVKLKKDEDDDEGDD